MAYYRDLREYLKVLEERGKMVRIRRSVNKDTEIHPLVKLQYLGLHEEDRRAFFFENVIDSNGKVYDTPVVVGALASSSQMYATGLMCRVEQIHEKLTQAQMNPIGPRVVREGPVQAEVHVGDNLLEHGGLSEFPIPIATPGFDPAPYITAGCWVSKDPDTNIPNVGMYRAMLKSPLHTGLNFGGPTQGGFIHLRKCKERGMPLPAAIIIGGPPSIGYVAVSPLPVDTDEFAVAGGIAGAPLELVKCKTVDLEVPAMAEIIIEGEIPTNEMEPEAPFGEANGFVGIREMNPYFRVKCITHRRKPIWLATSSQYPPSESSKIRQLANEAILYEHLRYNLRMEHVLEVGFPDSIGSSRLAAIRVSQVGPAEVRRTLEAVARRMPGLKIIMAVDGDVNVHDLDSLLFTLVQRTQPRRDYWFDTLPAPNLMDYSLEPLEQLREKQRTQANRPEASRLFIDATMKWPYPPLSLPKREFMDVALRIWQEEGLPPLRLKDPWWGVNLGYWAEGDEKRAQANVRGDYYSTGEEYVRERRPW